MTESNVVGITEDTPAELTLVWVNNVLEGMGKPTISELSQPDPENDSVGMRNSLAQSLGIPVYRMKAPSCVFTDIGDGEIAQVLASSGNCQSRPYRPVSTEKRMRYDVRLPWFTWESAA